MAPCVLCNVDYDVELDDEDDIQVTLISLRILRIKDRSQCVFASTSVSAFDSVDDEIDIHCVRNNKI